MAQQALEGRPMARLMADSSPRAIVARVSSAGGLKDEWLAEILRQVPAHQSMARLDQIADAAEERNLVFLLTIAGSPSVKYGVRYPNALSRLIKIYERTGSLAAVRALLEVGDNGPGLAFLRQIATENSPGANEAVTTLISETAKVGRPRVDEEGKAALAALRELFRSGQVTQRVARTSLEWFAGTQNWRQWP